MAAQPTPAQRAIRELAEVFDGSLSALHTPQSRAVEASDLHAHFLATATTPPSGPPESRQRTICWDSLFTLIPAVSAGSRVSLERSKLFQQFLDHVAAESPIVTAATQSTRHPTHAPAPRRSASEFVGSIASASKVLAPAQQEQAMKILSKLLSTVQPLEWETESSTVDLFAEWLASLRPATGTAPSYTFVSSLLGLGLGSGNIRYLAEALSYSVPGRGVPSLGELTPVLASTGRMVAEATRGYPLFPLLSSRDSSRSDAVSGLPESGAPCGSLAVSPNAVFALFEKKLLSFGTGFEGVSILGKCSLNLSTDDTFNGGHLAYYTITPSFGKQSAGVGTSRLLLGGPFLGSAMFLVLNPETFEPLEIVYPSTESQRASVPPFVRRLLGQSPAPVSRVAKWAVTNLYDAAVPVSITSDGQLIYVAQCYGASSTVHLVDPSDWSLVRSVKLTVPSVLTGALCAGCSRRLQGKASCRCPLCNITLCTECRDAGYHTAQHSVLHPLEAIPEGPALTDSAPITPEAFRTSVLHCNGRVIAFFARATQTLLQFDAVDGTLIETATGTAESPQSTSVAFGYERTTNVLYLLSASAPSFSVSAYPNRRSGSLPLSPFIVPPPASEDPIAVRTLGILNLLMPLTQAVSAVTPSAASLGSLMLPARFPFGADLHPVYSQSLVAIFEAFSELYFDATPRSSQEADYLIAQGVWCVLQLLRSLCTFLSHGSISTSEVIPAPLADRLKTSLLRYALSSPTLHQYEVAGPLLVTLITELLTSNAQLFFPVQSVTTPSPAPSPSPCPTPFAPTSSLREIVASLLDGYSTTSAVQGADPTRLFLSLLLEPSMLLPPMRMATAPEIVSYSELWAKIFGMYTAELHDEFAAILHKSSQVFFVSPFLVWFTPAVLDQMSSSKRLVELLSRFQNRFLSFFSATSRKALRTANPVTSAEGETLEGEDEDDSPPNSFERHPMFPMLLRYAELAITKSADLLADVAAQMQPFLFQEASSPETKEIRISAGFPPGVQQSAQEWLNGCPFFTLLLRPLLTAIPSFVSLVASPVTPRPSVSALGGVGALVAPLVRLSSLSLRLGLCALGSGMGFLEGDACAYLVHEASFAVCHAFFAPQSRFDPLLPSQSTEVQAPPEIEIKDVPHPYPNNHDWSREISIPGCMAYQITFDARCATEANYDYLKIFKARGQANPIHTLTGRQGSWPTAPILVTDTPTLYLVFHSDGSNNDWGFECIIRPDPASWSAQVSARTPVCPIPGAYPDTARQAYYAALDVAMVLLGGLSCFAFGSPWRWRCPWHPLIFFFGSFSAGNASALHEISRHEQSFGRLLESPCPMARGVLPEVLALLEAALRQPRAPGWAGALMPALRAAAPVKDTERLTRGILEDLLVIDPSEQKPVALLLSELCKVAPLHATCGPAQRAHFVSLVGSYPILLRDLLKAVQAVTEQGPSAAASSSPSPRLLGTPPPAPQRPGYLTVPLVHAWQQSVALQMNLLSAAQTRQRQDAEKQQRRGAPAPQTGTLAASLATVVDECVLKCLLVLYGLEPVAAAAPEPVVGAPSNPLLGGRPAPLQRAPSSSKGLVRSSSFKRVREGSASGSDLILGPGSLSLSRLVGPAIAADTLFGALRVRADRVLARTSGPYRLTHRSPRLISFFPTAYNALASLFLMYPAPQDAAGPFAPAKCAPHSAPTVRSVCISPAPLALQYDALVRLAELFRQRTEAVLTQTPEGEEDTAPSVALDPCLGLTEGALPGPLRAALQQSFRGFCDVLLRALQNAVSHNPSVLPSRTALDMLKTSLMVGFTSTLRPGDATVVSWVVESGLLGIAKSLIQVQPPWSRSSVAAIRLVQMMALSFASLPPAEPVGTAVDQIFAQLVGLCARSLSVRAGAPLDPEVGKPVSLDPVPQGVDDSLLFELLATLLRIVHEPRLHAWFTATLPPAGTAIDLDSRTFQEGTSPLVVLLGALMGPPNTSFRVARLAALLLGILLPQCVPLSVAEKLSVIPPVVPAPPAEPLPLYLATMPLQLNRAITTFLHTLLCSSAVSAQSWAATLAASVGEGILGLPKALEATGLAGKLDKPINRISRQIARGLHSLSVLSGNLSQAIRVGSLVQTSLRAGRPWS
ncbi:hypothetical protein PAPYR_10654 [Paratrimastix pyriformis]|uniref:Uncharacterized protein n=1 Tax=Paratrimastix pyriformis TaxID=342808 RepID=A0ABQ8U5H4_9EUKA|nr:hypothetical protein PAPYR_10654 [Paratrimastix pyriformis]